MFRLFVCVAAFTLVSASASAAEIVRYQCETWKAKHVHEAEKADTITTTLKKLGCDVKSVEHNGHTDVRYRCEKWRELRLKTHDEAVKWEKWFQEYGFKTEHRH